MKSHIFFVAAAAIFAAACNDYESVKIVFGTDIDARAQIKESRALARQTVIVDIDTVDNGSDKRFSYYFLEADESFPFRVCTPTGWDGKSKLPMVLFLHGGWNTESSYLDEHDKQMVRLADAHGVLLVSPLGAHAAYGNNLILPAEFGCNEEAARILSETSPERAAAQLISEKDVINVIELVLANYPVDRKNMFLTGHSMGGGGTWYIAGKYPDYWKAIAPMSGPFVLEEGYPWEVLRDKPIFVTEGSQAGASLESSRDLRDWLVANGFDCTYKEVDADHPGMVPLVLPDVFDFFDSLIK